MTDVNQNENRKDIVDFTVDPFSRSTLLKMAKWAQVLGVANIILGTLQALTILVFAIPLAAIGIVTIIMGTKLTGAASYLRLALYNQDLPSLHQALDQIRSYMTINGILQIIIVAIIIIFLLIITIFGFAISDFYESGFEFSIKHFL